MLVLHHREDPPGADLKHRDRRTRVIAVLLGRRVLPDELLHTVVEVEVDGRIDLVAALLQRIGVCGGILAEDVLAVHLILVEHVLDVVAEVACRFGRGEAAVARRRIVHVVLVDWDRRVLLELLLRDEALIRHLPEHPVASHLVLGEVRRVEQREVGRLVDDRDQRCGLGRVQLRGVDAEDLLSRRLDAVDRAAEVRDVEVGEQDLVLGVGRLQRHRQLDLAQLAVVVLASLLLNGLLVVPVERIHDDLLAHQLHRESRAARVAAADAELRHDRARERLRVDTGVRVEAAVLSGDGGVLRVHRHLFEVDDLAVLIEQARNLDRLAVAVAVDHSLILLLVDRRVVWQSLEHVDAAVRRSGSGGDTGSEGGSDQGPGRRAESDQSEQVAEEAAGLVLARSHTLQATG